MEAIILAGGQGTRLRPLISDLPKPMAPIAGKPFLDLLLQSLARGGFQRVVLALGFMADKIQNYFGDYFAGMEIITVVEPHPLGTGGAALLAMKEISSDHVFIFNGDTYLDVRYKDVEAHWDACKRPIIVGCNVQDTTRYGRLLIDQGRVTGFTEKGVEGPGLINAGCYVLPKAQLESYTQSSVFSLEQDFLIPLVSHTRVDVFETQGWFIDIGIPDDFIKAQSLLADLHH